MLKEDLSGRRSFLLLSLAATSLELQREAAQHADEQVLRVYTGAYRWGPDSWVYLQLWDEFSGFGKPRQLVSFDESGEVRVLYPGGKDQFTAGPGIAVATPVQSRIAFQRDGRGRITSLSWQRKGAPARTASRKDEEKRQDVGFSSDGNVRLWRERLLAPLLPESIRRSFWCMGPARRTANTCCRGHGSSSVTDLLCSATINAAWGNRAATGVARLSMIWPGIVVSAFEYLKSRDDIDDAQIGALGISQAGWILPQAAVRAKDMAFVISISGAGITPAETTLDETRNEMTMNGAPQGVVDNIVSLMKLQYRYVSTGEGWKEYAATRSQMAERRGNPPDLFPGTPDSPYFQTIRRTYFYDPVPALRALKTPTLAIWGELDDNIVAEKNKAAWDAALRASGNPDYTLTILPKGDHSQWQAKTRSNAEMKSLGGFVPEYYPTVREWLTKRVHNKSSR